MNPPFEIKKADELLDAEFIAKWEERRRIDPLARSALRTILDRFIAGGGPVTVSEFPAEARAAIARLDEKDLILVEDGQIRVAYPFSGTRTTFIVVLPDGRQRYAVCAIDALGIPAMLGQPVSIRSSCHHCGEPVELGVGPDGPVGSGEVMVWVGKRGDIRQKACASICLTLNFFRSEEHLRSWWKSHPNVPGAAAVLEEAFKVAAKIFGEFLREL
jgi:hypothetical protein